MIYFRHPLQTPPPDPTMLRNHPLPLRGVLTLSIPPLDHAWTTPIFFFNSLTYPLLLPQAWSGLIDHGVMGCSGLYWLLYPIAAFWIPPNIFFQSKVLKTSPSTLYPLFHHLPPIYPPPNLTGFYSGTVPPPIWGPPTPSLAAQVQLERAKTAKNAFLIVKP